MTAPAGPYYKGPTENLDYGVDWSKWLATGETISTSAWTVATGLVVGTQSNTTTATVVWLSGGTAGAIYTAMNQITTNQGRTAARTLQIVCEAR